MISSRNPVLSRGFAHDDLDPAALSGQAGTRVPMTLAGTLHRVAILFIPLLATAVLSYLYAPPALLLPAIIAGAGLGFWATLSKKTMPAVMLAYAVVEGVVLGVLSAVFEARYPGIVAQAVLATLLTAGAVFLLCRARILKATARFARILVYAAIGYCAFLFVNLVFAMFGAGDGTGIYATPLGFAIAAFGALLAAGFLVLDFDTIEKGIAQGAPEEMEWRAAFGLMVTLIWLYLEILRLIGLARR